MNGVESLLEAQTTALLRRLAREQDSRIHRIRDEAALQAADIVRKARAEARARVHQAVLDTRRDDELTLTRRRAALETGSRQCQQAALRDWLEDAWGALPAALQARWLDPQAREQWCAAALQSASRTLLHTDGLQVQVSPRWVADVEPHVQRCLAANHNTGTVVADDGISEGLRIRAGCVCLDATTAGLLAPRECIAAELLAEFGSRTAPQHSGEPA
jgi:hypothetical protein